MSKFWLFYKYIFSLATILPYASSSLVTSCSDATNRFLLYFLHPNTKHQAKTGTILDSVVFHEFFFHSFNFTTIPTSSDELLNFAWGKIDPTISPFGSLFTSSSSSSLKRISPKSSSSANLSHFGATKQSPSPSLHVRVSQPCRPNQYELIDSKYRTHSHGSSRHWIEGGVQEWCSSLGTKHWLSGTDMRPWTQPARLGHAIAISHTICP